MNKHFFITLCTSSLTLSCAVACGNTPCAAPANLQTREMQQVCCCLASVGTSGHSWCCLLLSAGWPNNTGQQTLSPGIILRVQAPRLRHLKEKIHNPEAEHKIFTWRGRALINFGYKCLQLKVVINNLPKAMFQFALTVLYYMLYFQETIIIIAGHGISSCLMNV